MYRIDCSVYAHIYYDREICYLLARRSRKRNISKQHILLHIETNIIREDRVNVGVTTSARTQNLNEILRLAMYASASVPLLQSRGGAGRL